VTTGRTATPDGTAIATVAGHPVYTFSQDQQPGDVNGEGVAEFGGTWYAVSPTGQPVTGTQQTPSSGSSRLRRPDTGRLLRQRRRAWLPTAAGRVRPLSWSTERGTRSRRLPVHRPARTCDPAWALPRHPQGQGPLAASTRPRHPATRADAARAVRVLGRVPRRIARRPSHVCICSLRMPRPSSRR
jgi:hypothetical protein